MRDIVTLQLIPTVSMQTKVANFNGGQGRMRTDVFFLSVEIASIDWNLISTISANLYLEKKLKAKDIVANWISFNELNLICLNKVFMCHNNDNEKKTQYYAFASNCDSLLFYYECRFSSYNNKFDF